MCNLHWCYTFCTGVTLFTLVLHLNCTALSQSESSNFFMYIIRPGIKCLDWSKLYTDPCKHHCFRICPDPCEQAVQEQNSSVQKFIRTGVNGA